MDTEIDTSRPHAARMLDYWLGGHVHYAADRAAAEDILSINPHQVVTARQNRAWIGRVVRYLTGTQGITQYLDLGSGIPTSPNLHETAQQIAPETRVVYLDHDPIVSAHAGALLGTTPQGRIAYVQADFTAAAELFDLPGIAAADDAGHRVLDPARPMAVCLNSALHFIEDDDRARAVVRSLASRLAPGSYLTISHITPDWAPEIMTALVSRYRRGVTRGGARTRAEIASLVDGLEVVEPGIVCVADWRPDPDDRPAPPPEHVNLYGLVARVP